MMTARTQAMAGMASQLLGQVLAGWALVAHFLDWPITSVWVVTPLVAAILVPFRHDGSLKDRAIGNFGSASVVAGMISWEFMMGGIDGVLGGAGVTFGPFTWLTLAAATLFSIAGAAFWLLRDDRAA